MPVVIFFSYAISTSMLTLHHNRHWYEPRLPHVVFIDGLFYSTMHVDTMKLDIPAGCYNLRVQFGGRLPLGKSGRSIDLSLSSTCPVEVRRNSDTTLVFHDRERIWNILFDIDLAVWIVSLFVAMPVFYKIFSDAFFLVWLLRLVLIRKRYYRIHQL